MESESGVVEVGAAASAKELRSVDAAAAAAADEGMLGLPTGDPWAEVGVAEEEEEEEVGVATG